jgi:hypothetical protein
MRSIVLVAGLLTIVSLGSERKVIVQDEEGQGIAEARIEVVLTPPDDPRLASVVAFAGASDPTGCFRFAADDRLIFTRVRAGLPGFHGADVDHRHGLGRPTGSTELTLTLPRVAELVPLHYREVSLYRLPSGKRIGFDAEVGDAIAPWGKGKVADFSFRIESEQVGWTESAETLAALRRTTEGIRMDEQEWAETYGRFRGRLYLSFPYSGDGIRTTPSFWPYCLLKMPAIAPDEGYAQDKFIEYDTIPMADPKHDLTGYYLRLRTRLAPDGKTASAHYAKIHGRFGVGPGRVTFRFYYNPRTNDRRLAFDPDRNLLRPSGPGEPVHRFETRQP